MVNALLEQMQPVSSKMHCSAATPKEIAWRFSDKKTHAPQGDTEKQLILWYFTPIKEQLISDILLRVNCFRYLLSEK